MSCYIYARKTVTQSDNQGELMKGRAKRIAAVLAEHPGGLSTPQIAELAGDDVSGPSRNNQPRQVNLSRCGAILRRMEKRGEVARAGIVPGAYNNVPTGVWRTTKAVVCEPRPREAGAARPPSGGEKVIDPLIVALIAKLPPEGTPFPRAERERWLELMRLTLDLIYGECGEPVRAPLAVAG
jgi:hypothetical protein